jgi:hypothetical protein
MGADLLDHLNISIEKWYILLLHPTRLMLLSGQPLDFF